MDGFFARWDVLRMNAKNLIGRQRLSRDGRTTVSLEGLLTGVSTWLAFSLLLNDRAEASPGGASALAGAATEGGSSGGEGEGGSPGRMPVAQRSAPRRPNDSGQDWGGLANGAQEDSGPALGHGGDGLTNRRRPTLGGDGAQGTSSRPNKLLPAPAALGDAPQASSPGGGFGGAGGFSHPLGSPTGPCGLRSRFGRGAPGMAPAYTPARTPTGHNAPAPLPSPAPDRKAPLAATQPPRGLVVVVAGEETVVARSYAGPAVVRAQSSQVALDDTTIDSRGGTTEDIEVVASRRLHALATSTQGAADLGFDGETIGASLGQRIAAVVHTDGGGLLNALSPCTDYRIGSDSNLGEPNRDHLIVVDGGRDMFLRGSGDSLCKGGVSAKSDGIDLADGADGEG